MSKTFKNPSTSETPAATDRLRRFWSSVNFTEFRLNTPQKSNSSGYMNSATDAAVSWEATTKASFR